MVAFEWPEWDQVFLPDGSLFESFLRGVAVYVAVLALFRIVMKRQLGSLGFGDVLLLVLVSECVSQALANNKNSIPNGIATVAALLLCNYLIDYLIFKSRWFRRLVQPDPVRLVLQGQPIRENLKKERITDDELLTHLRINGLEDPSGAKSVCLESEGEISVVPMQKNGPTGVDHDPEVDADGIGPPDFDAAMRRFLAAAHRLHDAAVWHDERAAEHKRQAAEARDALKRFGVQPRALLQTPGGANEGSSESNGVHAASDGAPS